MDDQHDHLPGDASSARAGTSGDGAVTDARRGAATAEHDATGRDLHTVAPADQPAWPDDAADSERRGPPSWFRVPWSWVDWGMALLFTIFFGAAVAGVLAVFLGLDPTEGIGLVVMGIVTQVAGLAGFLGWLAARDSLTWHLLGHRRPRASHLGWGLAAGIGGYIGFVVLMTAALRLIGIEELPQQESLLGILEGDTVVVVLGVLMVVVLAPLVEEVVYRGIIFQGMRDVIGRSLERREVEPSTRDRAAFWLAAGGSSIIFGIVHVELLLRGGVYDPTGWVSITGITLLAVWFSWLLHRTGSIVVPMIAHGVFNGTMLGLAFLVR